MVPEAASRQADSWARERFERVLFKFLAITHHPIGRWLRRFSLDDSPSCGIVVRGTCPWSVLGRSRRRGRRVQRRHAAEAGRQARNHRLVAGQCRSNLSSAEAERLDVRYVENWSLGADLLILWRTARAVITGSGAW